MLAAGSIICHRIGAFLASELFTLLVGNLSCHNSAAVGLRVKLFDWPLVLLLAVAEALQGD